jgi:hypothetical protein
LSKSRRNSSWKLSDFVSTLNVPRTPSQQRHLNNEQEFDVTISPSSDNQHQLAIMSFSSAPTLAHVPAHGSALASDSSAHVTLALSPITLLPTTPPLIGKKNF